MKEMKLVMKKFHSFNDLETKLKQENIPYEDHKEDLLESLKTIKNNTSYLTRRVIIICASLLLFISLTTVAIATKGFGLIPSSESFIKDCNGEITHYIQDTAGNYVSQFGTCPTDENKDQKSQELEKIQDELDKEYESIKESLEANLPDDKIGIIIPVKNLDSIVRVYWLNGKETYDSIEDMRNNIINAPFPTYIPFNYDISTIEVIYGRSTKDDLAKRFEEAKAEGKDYYYNEYDRIPRSFTLNFDDGWDKLGVDYRIGESSILTKVTSGEHALEFEKFSHNDREYLCQHNSSYYSYFYASDQLWTINITTNVIKRDEVIEIVESMTY